MICFFFAACSLWSLLRLDLDFHHYKALYRVSELYVCIGSVQAAGFFIGRAPIRYGVRQHGLSHEWATGGKSKTCELGMIDATQNSESVAATEFPARSFSWKKKIGRQKEPRCVLDHPPLPRYCASFHQASVYQLVSILSEPLTAAVLRQLTVIFPMLLVGYLPSGPCRRTFPFGPKTAGCRSGHLPVLHRSCGFANVQMI